jgi:hypothetical protein
VQVYCCFLYYIADSEKSNEQDRRKREEKACAKHTKTRDTQWGQIGDNEQNDEISPNSKIYKAFDKNVLEKSVKITILITVKGFDTLHKK